VKITAIVPTFNEEHHVGRCLHSLLSQRGIDEDFEIIVVDGQSRDRTLDVVRSFPEFGSRISIVENPRRYQVYAWNLGCRAARGEYVAFISAHAAYGPNHFRACLDTIERTKATAVGPVQMAEGEGVLGRAIAWCMSTPFGIGNARYRFTQEEEEAESAFSMFLRKDTFERLGGYDERIAFDEDSEFSYRLRAAGGRVIVSPVSRVRYFVRNSLRGLARQMFCYGYWRRFTHLLHPRDVPYRVYVPPALVAALVASALLALTPLRPLALLAPLVYLGFVATAVCCAVPKIGLASAACVAAVLPCMHVWYGMGFWRALFTPQQRILLRSTRRSTAH
jgi:succinoglycan biosynthesis protein ExoA